MSWAYDAVAFIAALFSLSLIGLILLSVALMLYSLFETLRRGGWRL